METNASSNPGVPRKRIEYQYDGDSRRIARAERSWNGSSFPADPAPVRHFCKGWKLLAEGIPNGSSVAVKKSYLRGLDLAESFDATGNVGNLLAVVDQSGSQVVNLLPTYDGNGNIIALGDAGTGLRVAGYEYDAFGQRVTATNHAALLGQAAAIANAVAANRWGFSTKKEDPATELLYYGYRYYDPVLGRWPSWDPIAERGGINLYAFVTNNGVNQWDVFWLGWVPFIGDYEILDDSRLIESIKNGNGMKKSIFNTFLFCLTFLLVISCSERVAKVYDENSFKGRIFVSEKYNGGLQAKLQFSDKLNELKVLELPYDVGFTKKYEIFPGDESPSGRPTISIESWYYLIIKNETELIYRYYEGSHEKKLIFREVLK